MSLEDDQTTFPFEKSYKTGYAHFRRDFHEHMNVVGAYFCFYNYDLFPVAELTQYLSDLRSVFTIKYLPAILGSESYTILNHTELYEYKHGKMLMHLNFCFEGIPDRQSPAATLKYYRLRKGLTTRQLAESVGIVPATVLLYEKEQFPIPYQAAVDRTGILEIDKNLLFDDFALFLDAPYSDVLYKVRNFYGLNQTDFAEKAGISFGIYFKWESGSRQPSRKMYQKLVNAFSELKK